MSVQRLFANVWSFILTIVRSLFAFFSFRRRASDPFFLPSVNRTPNDALAHAHSHLRPILLTPRSISLVNPQPAQITRTRSAASTLFRGHGDDMTASPSVPRTSDLQRTSPDAELGLPVDFRGHPAASATSFRECTPDTTRTGSLYVLPLTPPDRCYLAPLPSATDCPYTEPWHTGFSLDCSKSRLPGSPLKLSTNVEPSFPEPMVASIGSPPPGRWSPVQLWTSTPCKNDSPAVPDPAFSPLEHENPSSALSTISHAIISRSQSSIRPYDDTNSSASSDVSPFVDLANGPTHKRHRAQAHVPRSKNQPHLRFHHPDAYAFAWRRHGDRFPGKADRTHAYARSHSHMDLSANVWYDADAFALSPVATLSPPRGESGTEDKDEDEDEIPLCRLRERLAGRSAAVGTTVGLGVPVSASTRKIAGNSPRTRRMSEGCLLAISESTPTRIGMGARPGQQVLSVALDGEYGTNDWLDALSLRFSSEHKGALTG